MKVQVGILAEAYYLPETKKKAQDIFNDEDIPFGTLAKNIDFRRDIGIEEVHVTDEMSSAVALKAVQRVMEQAGISGKEIDVIVDFTSIPEDFIGPTWSLAGFIQDELGATNAFCTAITTGGCASYHFAVRAVCAMMASDSNINTALLVAGDRTPDFNKTYYPITVASDGGSALILQKGCDRAVIQAIETISIGRLHDVWYVPGFNHRHQGEPVTEKLLHMHCDMKKFNEGVIIRNFYMFGQVLKKILKKVDMTINDIDYFVYPTFSTWDQAYFCESTKIPREKVYTAALRNRGHVQESDMVVNYVDALAEGFIKKGDLVMIISNGAGFAWSAVLVKH